MGDDSNTVRVPRAWIFMVMGAAIIGAGIAAVVMVNWIVPRLAKTEAARVLPVQNAPANEPAVNREVPPANTPGKPPPVKPPLPPGEVTKPPEEIPPQPPPPEDPLVHPEISVRDFPAGAAFKFKLPGGAWIEGTDTTPLSAGARVRVTSGRVRFEAWQAQVVGLAGCDFTLEAKQAEHSLILNEGSVLFERAHVPGPLTLVLPQQTLSLEGAILAAQAAPDFGLIELTSGTARFGKQSVDGRTAPTKIRFGAATSTESLSYTRAAEIEEYFRPERDVLLAWDFEGKQLPCNLGKRVTPGFRNSGGALISAPDFAAIGDEGDATFTPAQSTRIRLRLKTNARSVRVSFIAGRGRLAETWTCTLLEHERDQWSLYEFALSDFSKPFKEARAQAGQTCHSLQFRMRFDDHDPTLPSERYLLVDDLEIFTPK